MALLASQSHMLACQWEGAQVVIEVGILPVRRIMTGSAIGAKLPFVFVILLMAGKTVRGRTSKLSVHMARFTSNFTVPALQFESRKIMVKFCRRPTLR